MTIIDIHALKDSGEDEATVEQAIAGAERVHKYAPTEVRLNFDACPECRELREIVEPTDDELKAADECDRCDGLGLVERAADGDEMEGFSLPFIISTPTVDRDADTIRVEGWKLKNFRKNPVMLFGHNSRDLPVARAPDTKIDRAAKVLRSVSQFPAADFYAFGNLVGRMFKRKFLNATSVGFRALKFERADDREGFYPINFLEQELLEFSAVPIPANPEALVQARSAGLDLGPLVQWAERVLDKANESGLWIPRSQLEEAWKRADGDRLSLLITRDGGLEALGGVVGGGVPWEVAHPDGHTDEAPLSESFKAADRADAVVNGLPHEVGAWVDPEDDEDVRAVHHRADGAVVWRALTRAMADVLGEESEVPAEDRAAVHGHLARHYRDNFGTEPPAFASYGAKEIAEIERFGVVLDWANEPAKAAEAVGKAMAADQLPDGTAENVDTDGAGCFSVSREDVAAMVTEELGQLTAEVLDEIKGSH